MLWILSLLMCPQPVWCFCGLNGIIPNLKATISRSLYWPFICPCRRFRIGDIRCKLPRHLIKGCLDVCSKISCMCVSRVGVRCTMIVLELTVCLCITSSKCHPSAPPPPAGRGTVRRIEGVKRSGKKTRSASYRSFILFSLETELRSKDFCSLILHVTQHANIFMPSFFFF